MRGAHTSKCGRMTVPSKALLALTHACPAGCYSRNDQGQVETTCGRLCRMRHLPRAHGKNRRDRVELSARRLRRTVQIRLVVPLSAGRFESWGGRCVVGGAPAIWGWFRSGSGWAAGLGACGIMNPLRAGLRGPARLWRFCACAQNYLASISRICENSVLVSVSVPHSLSGAHQTGKDLCYVDDQPDA